MLHGLVERFAPLLAVHSAASGGLAQLLHRSLSTHQQPPSQARSSVQPQTRQARISLAAAAGLGGYSQLSAKSLPLA
jgi:hypothetical protein